MKRLYFSLVLLLFLVSFSACQSTSEASATNQEVSTQAVNATIDAATEETDSSREKITSQPEPAGREVSTSTDPSKNVLDLGLGKPVRIRFSPDGSLVGAATTTNLNVYHVVPFELTYTFVLQSEPVDLIFSTDSQLLAVSFEDDTVQIYNSQTGSLLITIMTRGGNTGHIHALAFSPDSKLLAGVAEHYGLYIWDASTGKEVRYKAGGFGHPILTFSSTDNWLANGFEVINTISGDTVRDQPWMGGSTSGPDGIIFTPSGITLYLASVRIPNSYDSKLILTTIQEDQSYIEMKYEESLDECNIFRTSSDESKIAAACYTKILIWDSQSGNFVEEKSVPNFRIQDFLFDLNNDLLVVAEDGHSIMIQNDSQPDIALPPVTINPFPDKTSEYQVITPDNINQIREYSALWDDEEYAGSFSDIPVWSHDGEYYYRLIGNEIFVFKLIDLFTTDDQPVTKSIYRINCEDCNSLLGISPNAKTIAVSTDKLIKLIDIDSQQPKQTLEKYEYGPVLFTSDSKAFTYWTDDGLEIINVTTGQSLQKFPPGLPSSLTISPDERYLAMIGRFTDGTIGLGIWDISNGQLVHKLFSGIIVASVKFSMDSTFIFSAPGHEDEVFEVWEVDTGQLVNKVYRVEGLNEYSFNFAVSPDGQLLAAAEGDNFIRFYDTNTFQMLHEIDLNHRVYQGSSKQVMFVGNGKFIAIHAEGALWIWGITH